MADHHAVVRKHFGAALAQKATPELATAIARAVRAASSSGRSSVVARPNRTASSSRSARMSMTADLFSPFDSFVPEVAKPARAEAGAHRPGAHRLRATIEIDWEPRIDLGRVTTLRRQRVARRRTAARLEAAFLEQSEEVVAALSEGRKQPSLQPCWLNGQVYCSTSIARLATIADISELGPIGLEPVVTFDQAASGTTGARTPTSFAGWTGSHRGQGVQIALVDGEVADHAWLGDRVVRGGDFTPEGWDEPQRHGTFMAGLIVADGDVLVGSAPAASLHQYKVLSTSEGLTAPEARVVLALERAVQDGADVVSCSFHSSAKSDGSTLGTAFARAIALNCAVVRCAGNGGPAAGSVGAPSDVAGVVIVGACDRGGSSVLRYSGRGPTPAGREAPDIYAPGGSTSDPLTGPDPSGKAQAGFGTSHATALVSGLVACLREADPTVGALNAAAELQRIARPLASTPGAVLV